MISSLFPVSGMKKRPRDGGTSREWLGEKGHSCDFEIPRQLVEEEEGKGMLVTPPP